MPNFPPEPEPAPAAAPPPQRAPAASPESFRVEFKVGDEGIQDLDVRCHQGSARGRPPVIIESAGKGPCRVTAYTAEGPQVAFELSRLFSERWGAAGGTLQIHGLGLLHLRRGIVAN